MEIGEVVSDVVASMEPVAEDGSFDSKNGGWYYYRL